MARGIFITFEGPEGCGKTTHARLLYDYLRKKRRGVVLTREPGGTRTGELVRQVLLHSRNARISDLAELFLFEACRAQIVRQVLRPALAKRAIVICDRYSDATLAYQGYGGGIPLATIKALNEVSTGALEPDLTILLDVDTATGLGRAKKKGVDRMEGKDLAYHRRVRAGYLALAKRWPSRIKIIRVRGSIEETQGFVRREAEIVIQKSEVRRQRSDVRGQTSEVRRQRSDVRGQTSVL
jgi:dTMP kinase